MNLFLLTEGTVVKLQQEATDNPHILGTLKGLFIQYGVPGINKRVYSRELWEKVISSDDVKDAIQRRMLFGELDHPSDRIEVRLNNISHVITGLEIDEKAGGVVGTMEILNTPAGKILYTLVESGSQIGVSSRALGKLNQVKESDVTEVDMDSYRFITFDVVSKPSYHEARPAPVKMRPRMEGVNRADFLELDRELVLTEAIEECDSLETVSALRESYTGNTKLVDRIKQRASLLELKQNGKYPVVFTKLEESFKEISRLRRALERKQDVEALTEEAGKAKEETPASTGAVTIPAGVFSTAIPREIAAEKEQLHKKIEELEAEKEALEVELGSMRDTVRLATSGDPVSLSIAEVTQYQNKIREGEEKLAEKDATILAISEAGAIAHEDIRKFLLEIASYETVVTALKKERDRLFEQLGVKDSIIESLNGSLQDYSERLQEADGQTQELEDRISVQEELLTEAQEQIVGSYVESPPEKITSEIPVSDAPSVLSEAAVLKAAESMGVLGSAAATKIGSRKFSSEEDVRCFLLENAAKSNSFQQGEVMDVASLAPLVESTKGPRFSNLAKLLNGGKTR